MSRMRVWIETYGRITVNTGLLPVVGEKPAGIRHALLRMIGRWVRLLLGGNAYLNARLGIPRTRLNFLKHILYRQYLYLVPGTS